jgi:nitrogen fixation/metabolism regulation signal transduction histidine kinase
MSALPDDTGPTSDLLRDAREALDDAARRLDDLTEQVSDRRAEVDLLETILDAVLEAADTALVVIDPRRRVTACSRAAAEHLGCEVGAALSKIVPADVAGRVGELLEAGEPAAGDLPELGAGARVQVLPTGHAILALPASGRSR